MASVTSDKRNRTHPSMRFGALWHHADFLKLWAGETVSMFGSEVSTLALPLTAVVLLKATSVQLGFLYAAEFAPFLFLTLFAGVWVDHKRRRPILIVTNVGRAALLGLIPILAYAGWLRLEYMYIIALLVGSLTVFFYLAFQAFLPTLVQREQLVEGNSKLSASKSTAEIGGPGLAGLLVQLVTAPGAIVLDAVSFLVASGSLILMRTPEPILTRTVNVHSLLHEIGEGFRITFSNRYLRAFSGEAATYNLFWQMILTVFVLYAVRELGFSSGILGLIFAIGSAGALFGALFTNYTARRIGVGLTIVGAAALSDATLLVLPFITRSTTGAVLILLGAFFLQGVGITGCNVHVDSIRQAIIPNQLQGSANASYRLLVSGALPLGALLGGFLGQWIGLQQTLLVGALGLLSTWLWIVFSPVPRLRTFPILEDEHARAASEKSDTVEGGSYSQESSFI